MPVCICVCAIWLPLCPAAGAPGQTLEIWEALEQLSESERHTERHGSHFNAHTSSHRNTATHTLCCPNCEVPFLSAVQMLCTQTHTLTHCMTRVTTSAPILYYVSLHADDILTCITAGWHVSSHQDMQLLYFP